MADLEEQVEAGFERDRITTAEGAYDIRWWFFLSAPGEKLRNARARLGVVDHGFRFARGGRVSTVEEAEILLGIAAEEAEREVAYWRGQPSHALGANGELIPLDEVRSELTS